MISTGLGSVFGELPASFSNEEAGKRKTQQTLGARWRFPRRTCSALWFTQSKLIPLSALTVCGQQMRPPRWKAKVEQVASTAVDRLRDINTTFCLSMWEFQPEANEAIKLTEPVMQHLDAFIIQLRDAMLSFCNLRMKQRAKITFGHEFLELSGLVASLDAGERDWGPQGCAAVQSLAKAFAAENNMPRFQKVVAAMRRSLSKAALAQWSVCVKELLLQAEHLSAPWEVPDLTRPVCEVIPFRETILGG